MEPVRIVVLDGSAANPGDLSWDAFDGLGELTVYDLTDPDQVIERLQGAQVVLTNKTVLSREVFTACPTIRYAGVLSTGCNVIDLDAAKTRGITVTNIPAYSTQSVAQFTFALLLELCHRVGHHNTTVHAGKWSSAPQFCYWDYPLIELSGKTMGLMGYGNIGSAVARIALTFGMRVVAHTPHPEKARPADGVTFAGLDAVLAQADVLSLHCPLTESSRELIRAETLAKMKDGAILINTARGPLVNEDDLAEALKSGKLYGAALDVLTQEPPVEGSPLMGLDNCIITPHIAWAPRETRARLIALGAENIRAWLAGTPQNVVC